MADVALAREQGPVAEPLLVCRLLHLAASLHSVQRSKVPPVSSPVSCHLSPLSFFRLLSRLVSPLVTS
jgi:hypothetical protein